MIKKISVMIVLVLSVCMLLVGCGKEKKREELETQIAEIERNIEKEEKYLDEIRHAYNVAKKNYEDGDEEVKQVMEKAEKLEKDTKKLIDELETEKEKLKKQVEELK